MLPAPLALLTWNLPPDLLFPFLKRCPFRELNSTRVEATFTERSTCNEARRPLFLNTACAAGLALIRADLARRWSGWKANYGPDLPWVGTRLSANRKRVEAKHPVLLHIMDVIAAVICVFHGWKSQWILREVFVLPVFFILFFFFFSWACWRTDTAWLWFVSLRGALVGSSSVLKCLWRCRWKTRRGGASVPFNICLLQSCNGLVGITGFTALSNEILNYSPLDKK